jgi:hypothetical protein
VYGVLAVSLDNFKFEDLVCMDNPAEVMEEVERVVLLMFPEFNFKPFHKTFQDVVKLFGGEYPGFKECNVHYHDLKHTTDCLMAMVRLIHGASVNGARIDQNNVALGLVSALLHDAGYIQCVEDDSGTGAKYTLTHVQRSIDFMKQYFSANGYSAGELQQCVNHLWCTGLDVRLDEIQFEHNEHAVLGKMLGTADLLGQMADRTYLERLPFLYDEFKEGGVPGFQDELDLLRKTPVFWEITKLRFAQALDNMDRYMRDHFRVRWGIDRDLYREAIERNIGHIKTIVQNHEKDYRKYLRRAAQK